MNVTLKPHLEKLVAERVNRGDYDSADSLVSEAVEWLLADDQDEIAEAQAAIDESIEQINRGETVALEDFDEEMRRKHGIPR